jgi:hypothetical protein
VKTVRAILLIVVFEFFSSPVFSQGSRLFTLPLEKDLPISSGFYGYKFPNGNWHSGTDFWTPDRSTGQRVVAALDGEVTTVVDTVPDNTGINYGNYVKIRHDNGYETIYAHLLFDSIAVSIGDSVKRGQILGRLGNTGTSTNPHLHFEVKRNKISIDPYDLNYTNTPEHDKQKYPPDVSMGVNYLWTTDPPSHAFAFAIHRFLPDQRVFIEANGIYYHIEDPLTLESYIKAGMSIIDHPAGVPVPEDKIHPYKIRDGMVFKETNKPAVFLFRAGIWSEWTMPGDIIVDWERYWQNYYAGEPEKLSVRVEAKEEKRLGLIRPFVDWQTFTEIWGFKENDIRLFPAEFIEQYCLIGKTIVSETRLVTDGRYRVAVLQSDTIPTFLNGSIELMAENLEEIPQLEGSFPSGPIPIPGLAVTFPTPNLSHTLLVDQDSVLLALNPAVSGGEDPITWMCRDGAGNIIANGVRGRAPTIWNWFEEGRMQVTCYASYTSVVDGYHYAYNSLDVDILPPPLPIEWGVPDNIHVNTIAADVSYIYIGGQEGNDPSRGYLHRVERDAPANAMGWPTGWAFNRILAGTPWGLLAATWRGLRQSPDDQGETWEAIFRGDEPVYDITYGSPCCDFNGVPRLLVGSGTQGYYGPWRIDEPFASNGILGLALGPYNVMKLRQGNIQDIALGSSGGEITYRRFCNGNSSPPCASVNSSLNGAVDVYSLYDLGEGRVFAAVKTDDDAGDQSKQSVWISQDYGQSWTTSGIDLLRGDDVVGFVETTERQAVVYAYTRSGSIFSSVDFGQTWAQEMAISKAMPSIYTDRGQFITTALPVDEHIAFGTTKGIRVTPRAILRAGLGDIDNDGEVTRQDAVSALRFATAVASPSARQRYAADVDENGRITARDALFILRYVRGLISRFPKLPIRSATAMSVVAHLSEAEQRVENRTAVNLIFNCPEDAAAGDILCEVKNAQVIEARIEGLSSEALSFSEVTESRVVRFSFAGSDEGLWRGQIVLHLELVGAGTSASLPLHLTGHFYDSQGMMVGEVQLKNTTSVLPAEYALLPNYPNPFNPVTNIRYQLPKTGFAILNIYNLNGQLVRTLIREQVEAGQHLVWWDGKDEQGQAVGSGVYFYRLVADEGAFGAVRRMVLLK